MSRSSVVWLALALVVAGCSGAPQAGPTETAVPVTESAEPSATPSPTATEVARPYAIPDDIDAAYVEEVVSALDGVWSQMLQAFVDSGDLDDPRRVELSLAVMTGSEAAEFAQGWSDLLERVPDALDNVRDPVGLPTTTVEEVVRADDSCIIARVDRDHGDVYIENEPAGQMQGWVVLERVPTDGPEAEYVSEHNRTPWRYAVVDRYTDSDVPDDAWC